MPTQDLDPNQKSDNLSKSQNEEYSLEMTEQSDLSRKAIQRV
jgi:hypothetical protein